MVPKYIKRETAKLFKTKNIIIDIDEIYFYTDEFNNIEEHEIKNEDILFFAFFRELDEGEYPAYEHWMVLEYLRNQNICVEIRRNWPREEYYFTISTEKLQHVSELFCNYDETTETAILYCLKKIL